MPCTDILTLIIEPRRDVIVSAAVRRAILVGSGVPPVQRNWWQRSEAWRGAKFSDFAYLFRKFFLAKNFCYQGMHVEQLFCGCQVSN